MGGNGGIGFEEVDVGEITVVGVGAAEADHDLEYQR